MTDFSEIEEMYLKTMFEIHSENPAAIVKTTQLADIKGVSAASVTEMIQRLSSRDMVTHIPYRGFRLTPSGFQLAARIKRREILLEILLRDVIGFEGDVHEVACKMEHAVGSDLESTLDNLLGYPEFSSEGKKIPSVDREIETIGISTLLPICKLPIYSTATVELIISSDTEAITIRECGIMIGSVIETLADSRTCDGDNLIISDSISMRILARINSIGG
ncbi:MAG: metal-dependent transcriptional regulator [Candidatus Thermoplasmatota archaeon]|nr:metal-dependent transcriptional regulator [Candidatus Thermoplasmatota archaeon]